MLTKINVVHAGQLNVVHADQLNVVHAGQLNVVHRSSYSWARERNITGQFERVS